MDYSPFYALLTVLGFLSVFFIIMLRVYKFFKRKEYMYRDVMSLQDGVLFLLSLGELKCMAVYPSQDSEQYYRLIRKGLNFLNIVEDEFHEIVKSTAEKALQTNSMQEVIFRLRHTSGDEKSWVKLSIREVAWDKNDSVFACVMKNQNEIMRLHSFEHEIIRQQKNLKVTSFDLLWKIDIETRQLTLLNDLVEEKHLVTSKPAGVYNLRELVHGSDYTKLEDELNFRVKHYLKNGKDVYSENPRIINIRLRSASSTGVWYGICGILDKDDDGRLVMYGAAHRLPIPVVSKISEFEIPHLFSVLMSSPTLRIFWCDLEGIILGCNKNFALDMGEETPEKLRGDNIENLELLKKEWVSYFYNHLREFSEYSINTPISKFFQVNRNHDNLEVHGQFNVLPLLNENGKAYGGLFMYWIQPSQGISRDRLTF